MLAERPAAEMLEADGALGTDQPAASVARPSRTAWSRPTRGSRARCRPGMRCGQAKWLGWDITAPAATGERASLGVFCFAFVCRRVLHALRALRALREEPLLLRLGIFKPWCRRCTIHRRSGRFRLTTSETRPLEPVSGSRFFATRPCCSMRNFTAATPRQETRADPVTDTI